MTVPHGQPSPARQRTRGFQRLLPPRPRGGPDRRDRPAALYPSQL